MLKIIPLSEAAAIDRLRNGLRQGLTRAFAEKTLAERRIWVHQMVADGATDEEIRSATGLRPVRIQAMRRDWLDAVEAARPAKVTPAKVEEMRAAAGRKTRKKR